MKYPKRINDFKRGVQYGKYTYQSDIFTVKQNRDNTDTVLTTSIAFKTNIDEISKEVVFDGAVELSSDLDCFEILEPKEMLDIAVYCLEYGHRKGMRDKSDEIKNALGL